MKYIILLALATGCLRDTCARTIDDLDMTCASKIEAAAARSEAEYESVRAECERQLASSCHE
jgi:hypothetical protein